MTTLGTDSREWGCGREGGEEVAATKLRGVTEQETELKNNSRNKSHGQTQTQRMQAEDTNRTERRNSQVIYTETAKRQVKDQEQ